MKERYRIKIFLAILFLQSLAANFAHPVTPTLIRELALPDYMFGLAFASMSFTLFLFSPFWGKMRDFFSARLLLLVGCVGYGAGQYLFSIAKSVTEIVFARFVSGFFVGAVGVSTLIFITEKSPKEKIGENLAALAIIQALGSSFGYFIGGSLGVYSTAAAFHLQVGTLVLCGLLFFFLSDKPEKKEERGFEIGKLLPEMNPFKSFIECKSLLNKGLVAILFVILVVTVGTNAFDQSFNYYLKAEFNFSSFYNGVLKAVNGLVTLFIVGTVCMRIIRKKKTEKSTGLMLLISVLCIGGMMLMGGGFGFLAIAVIFYSFNAMTNPLLQDMMVKTGKEEKRNMLMGLYNSVRSLGMILGALCAGFLYGFGADLPFFLSAGCFLLTGGMMLFSRKSKHGEKI